MKNSKTNCKKRKKTCSRTNPKICNFNWINWKGRCSLKCSFTPSKSFPDLSTFPSVSLQSLTIVCSDEATEDELGYETVRVWNFCLPQLEGRNEQATLGGNWTRLQVVESSKTDERNERPGNWSKFSSQFKTRCIGVKMCGCDIEAWTSAQGRVFDNDSG